MKGWLRSIRGMRWLTLAGILVALAVAVSRGQVPPNEMQEYGEHPPGSPAFPTGEPPMVDGPIPSQSPLSPSSPFTPPPPTPLQQDQVIPFVPGMPSPLPEAPGPLEPIVRLRVRAPARAEPNKDIEYQLTIENISRADAHHVWVRDRLPSGVKDATKAEPQYTEKKEPKDGPTDLLWDLGTLKAGTRRTIVLTIKPAGTEDVQNRAYVQFEHGQKVTTRIAKPSVQAKVTAPTQAIKYESILFRIEVMNTGSVPVRNVVVTDELPAGVQYGAVVKGTPEPRIGGKEGQSGDKLTWKVGDLPPNQTRRIEYQAIPSKLGQFRNNVKATADGGTSATGSASVNVVEPKLKISVSGPQRRLANRPIPYHITVRNLGSVALANVQVTDELPGRIEFISASSGGRREGGFVRWSLGAMQVGEVRSLDLVLRAPESGDCSNEARVQADNNLSDRANSGWMRIESVSTPVIEIDKAKGSLVVGEKAAYTIRLFNPGKNSVLNPSVIVTVPDEMKILGPRGATSAQQQGQHIHFDPLPALDGGKEELFFVDVEARKAGEATLRAWWTDGRQGSDAQNAWEDKTTILDPPGGSTAPAPAGSQGRDKEPPIAQESFRAPH
ncbi:MAG TPA: DUF11 domain-containing protein [Gemmataceae bacterium]|nr:DUF11 domain-containing protein [Gemmataceae bacterium]